jgi:hypothetical protein
LRASAGVPGTRGFRVLGWESAGEIPSEVEGAFQPRGLFPIHTASGSSHNTSPALRHDPSSWFLKLSHFSHAADAQMRPIQIPTQVSGHEFTHAVKPLKINSLLPQAPGPLRAPFLRMQGWRPSRLLA